MSESPCVHTWYLNKSVVFPRCLKLVNPKSARHCLEQKRYLVSDSPAAIEGGAFFIRGGGRVFHKTDQIRGRVLALWGWSKTTKFSAVA